ncbi:MAG TPA: CAP domain-containing protein, partial [Candidatus Paceibacterota bacterium]|nr:CAP domain-containing protein [Candidatus Paceibacterota bacterium]
LDTLKQVPVPPVASVSAARVVALTNEERTDDGIRLLSRNSLLDRAAQMKAEDMASKGYYAHVSPEGLTPMHWAEKAGYRYLVIGENLIVQRTSAEQVVDAFMGSPGHRANILREDFSEIGVGVASGTYKGDDTIFTVQMFAAPYPRAVATTVKPPVKASATSTPVVVKPVVPNIPTPLKPVVPITPPRVTAASSTLTLAPIDQRVKEIFDTLTAETISATSTPTTTATTTFTTPSFFLEQRPPIELAQVSRLETQTPPVPIGSTWSAQLQVFVDGAFRAMRSWFEG